MFDVDQGGRTRTVENRQLKRDRILRHPERPMAYKDLLVVLDSEPRARHRLALAADLAGRFGAHLVGLYVTVGLENSRRYHRSDAELVRDARAQFEEITGGRSFSAEWRAASGFPSDVTAVHARYADLTILGQFDPDDSWAPIVCPRPEDIALSAGRPTLVVPYIGECLPVGQRVLVGWDASREATRAVNDAMPFLAAAATVTVLTVDPEPSQEGHGPIPGADIGLHLARHGVNAQVARAVSAGIGVGNTLLSRASDIGADLLVMGAYAHSRVRELVLGGTTRTMLQSMTLPVLMAH
jgi:nucleotide-binding universal stress UspA family protein